MTTRTAIAKSTVLVLAKHALEAKLYVPGWIMQTWYEDPGYIRAITVAYRYNEPIGACVITKDRDIGTYVAKNYRRRGIGTIIVKRTLSAAKRRPIVHMGIEGSDKFYKATLSQKIKIH